MHLNVMMLLLLNVAASVSAYTYVWHAHPRAANKGNNVKYDKIQGGVAPKDNADVYLYSYPYGEIKYGYVPLPGSQGPVEYNKREGNGRLAERIPLYLLNERN